MILPLLVRVVSSMIQKTAVIVQKKIAEKSGNQSKFHGRSKKIVNERTVCTLVTSILYVRTLPGVL